MNLPTSLLFLFLAALLEAGGDALIRRGLGMAQPFARIGLFALGASVLLGYGFTVNVPTWDFGRLLGVYVVFFFVIAQLIGWVAFHQRPGPGILIGGAFILTGGLIASIVR